MVLFVLPSFFMKLSYYLAQYIIVHNLFLTYYIRRYVKIVLKWETILCLINGLLVKWSMSGTFHGEKFSRLAPQNLLRPLKIFSLSPVD